jgi:hypothetical protein
MDECGQALTTAIPAGHHTRVLGQPGEQALDLPTAAIAPQGAAVLGRRALPVAAMRCNPFDALGRESLIERITVVGTIPNNSSGSSPGGGVSEGSLDKGDFMWRSSSRVHGEWKTRNVRWGSNVIEDHAAEGNVQEMWSPYHGTQQGDPAKLGDALVKIAGMEHPPKLFVAGSDALAMIPPAIEARLQEVRAYQELSRSTDGTF